MHSPCFSADQNGHGFSINKHEYHVGALTSAVFESRTLSENGNTNALSEQNRNNNNNIENVRPTPNVPSEVVAVQQPQKRQKRGSNTTKTTANGIVVSGSVKVESDPLQRLNNLIEQVSQPSNKENAPPAPQAAAKIDEQQQQQLLLNQISSEINKLRSGGGQLLCKAEPEALSNLLEFLTKSIKKATATLQALNVTNPAAVEVSNRSLLTLVCFSHVVVFLMLLCLLTSFRLTDRTQAEALVLVWILA